MRRLLYILPLAVFVGVAVYFAVGLTKDPRLIPSTLIDQPVPDFDLPPLLTDKPGLKTADLKGEVSLVNVFASWCVRCRVEHPLLMRLAKDGAVPIHGLNWKNKREEAIAWLGELGDPYSRIGYDLENKAGIEWGVYGVPETYVIDREGRIRYKHIGPMFEETWKDILEPLIRELKG
ncbi:MAG: DsbE family thiol:disulfide interchange protein [Alphaproteobacteria bacterium]|jgi:cytochrome c biogenesis protein CcmG/thiol:disulfide interchange protein DsbE|nr:DsbE family thiol:disulfide interchange protein [Alphaproteobacteria bacterium]